MNSLQHRLPRIPDLLALHRQQPSRYPFLLESLSGSNANSRFDILFAFPAEELVCNAAGVLRGPGSGQAPGFLPALDAWWNQERRGLAAQEPPLPFCGGWFVYLGYEIAGQIEPQLTLPPFPAQAPLAFATRVPAAIIIDHTAAAAYAVAEAGHEALLEAMEKDAQHSAAQIAPPIFSPCAPAVAHEDDPARFLHGVHAVKEYIAAGDVFQVNLSRSWWGELPAGTDATDLYARLRDSNPAPFAGLLRHEDWYLASSSPERLVRVTGDIIDTRPIAGTRPRGATDAQDLQQWQILPSHPKERAEHIMLIDLERNDLGRVCVPGSVRVSELMVLESYRHVHHIVSNVQGRLRAGTTPGQVLAAVFPGGTITGCPKVRCMEIISEVEQVGRGPYTGSFGYLNRDGSLDMNILIRTISLQGQHWSLRAGAGIVADSDPERELDETRAKAKGLLTALQCGSVA